MGALVHRTVKHRHSEPAGYLVKPERVPVLRAVDVHRLRFSQVPNIHVRVCALGNAVASFAAGVVRVVRVLCATFPFQDVRPGVTEAVLLLCHIRSFMKRQQRSMSLRARQRVSGTARIWSR